MRFLKFGSALLVSGVLALLVAPTVSSSPASGSTCDNQFIWTVDDRAATFENPLGVMQKWSTDGALLDSFEFNSYRRFTGDISLSADGKHIYGITDSYDSNGFWAGPGYHDVLDSFSAIGPSNLASLDAADTTLTGGRIGPEEDYESTVNNVASNTRLEASWLVDNWANEVGYYWARGGAVISENNMIIDKDYASGQLLKIDLANGRTASNWINLHDADASLEDAGQTAGIPIRDQTSFNAWGLGGDVVLMADGDVLVIAWNNRFDTATGHPEATERPLLVRIHSNSSAPVITSTDTTATVVGRIDIPQRANDTSSPHAYGAGRAGDQLFIGTSNGYLMRMKDIPTTASLAPIAFDVVVDREGTTFGGAAGSNDFTISHASCIPTGGVPKKLAHKTFTGFLFEKSTLNASTKKAVKAWLAGKTAFTKVTCVGYTGFNYNKRSTAFLKKLALERATKVCNYIHSIAPGIAVVSKTTRLDTSKKSSTRRVLVTITN